MIGVVFAIFRPGKPPPLTLETVRSTGKRLELSNALAKRELGYALQVSREVGMARMRAKASNEIVRRGATRASVAVQALVILALAATALTTTIRAFAAPPTDPTGLWQLYDDKTGKPNGVVRLYIEGRRSSRSHRTTAPRKLTRGQVHPMPSAQTGKPFLGLFVAWALEPALNTSKRRWAAGSSGLGGVGLSVLGVLVWPEPLVVRGMARFSRAPASSARSTSTPSGAPTTPPWPTRM